MEIATQIKEEWKTQLPDAVIRQAEEAKEKVKQLTVHNPDVKEKDGLDMEVVNVDTDDKPVKQEPVQVPDDDDAFKTKYNVLKGKFDAMAREKNSRVAELESQIATLRDTVDNLNRIIAMPPEKEPDTKTTKLSDVELNEESFEGYGPEMVDLLNEVKSLKATVKEYSQEIANLKGVAPKVDRMEQDAAIARDQSLKNEITRHCKHWETINALQDANGDYVFSVWLGDGGLANFTQAYRSGDAARVGKYFNDFIRHTGWTPEGDQEIEDNSLEDQVVPDTGRAVTSTGPKPAKTITDAQFQSFTKQAVMGEISQEEFRAISTAYYKQKNAGR